MNAFDKIIGYESIKQELVQIADTLKNHEVYGALGASSPKGLLLHGEPGVGKTLMAKCLIEASGREAFTCRKADPDGAFVETIRKTFERAAENTPSIVFLDDMDKFANDDENHRNSDEYVTVQSCIDEVKDAEVFVLATANELDNLPYSLRRAGRFDRVIEVETPTGNDAALIIERYLKGKKLADGLDSDLLARILVGRSCAVLETVVNEAGLLAGFRRDGQITMDHMIEACMRSVFNVPAGFLDGGETVDLMGDGTATQVIWHEAGHAVMAELLRPGSVALTSARSRSNTNGVNGFTISDLRDHDSVWGTYAHIFVDLAARAAVEMKCGCVDTGSSQDLGNAFARMGRIQANDASHGLFLHNVARYGGSSDVLDREREIAACTELESCYRKVKAILRRNDEFLVALASALAEKKALTAPEIAEVRNGCTIVEPGLLF